MSESTPDFFLASSEGHIDSPPRRCWVLGELDCRDRADLKLVRVEPPLSGRLKDGSPTTIQNTVLTGRHTEYGLNPITKWPTYVYICHVARLDLKPGDKVNASELEIIAWGDLYPTMEEADKNNLAP